MAELTMPRLSDTMQEGTIARWLKRQGDQVEPGEVLAEIETDKATMELESYESGVLQQILVKEGQTVPIGQAIAVIGEGGDAHGDGGSGIGDRDESRASGGPRARATDQAGEAAQEPGPTVTAADSPPESRGELTAKALQAATESAPSSSAAPSPIPHPPSPSKIKASPLARAMARDRGLDLATLEGSGPGGRVIAADVEAALAQPATTVNGHAAAAAPPQAAPRAAPADDVEEVPLSNLRKVVARRMLESVQTAPHFFLTTRVDVEALLALREQLNAQLEADKRDLKLSLNDLLVKACALALRAEPDANVSFAGDKILRYKRAHVGIAVATDRGLVVPVLRDADHKPLGQLAREARELIEKARSGKLTPDDYNGGTFTISNLGMYDVEHFAAIINPPQAAILAVGAAIPEVLPWNGQPAVRRTMRMTLSVDHRALDGASGAKFLKAIKELLEAPSRLVIQTESW